MSRAQLWANFGQRDAAGQVALRSSFGLSAHVGAPLGAWAGAPCLGNRECSCVPLVRWARPGH
eukprot:6389149-Lingulodinium_polyedra.AAC.1